MGRSDNAFRWMPLAVTLFGMAFYTTMTKGLALATSDLAADTTLKRAATITGQAAALLHFRAAEVLVEISAFASVVVSISLLAMCLSRPSAKFHLRILFGQALLAVIINASAPSPVTDQLARVACSAQPTMSGTVSFCASSAAGVLRAAPSPIADLDLHQLLNLTLAVAAACAGYVAFALAVAGRMRGKVGGEAYEKAISLVMACGAGMLVFSTLAEREYARWAFSDVVEDTNVQAFIDGVTFYAGATSSALLAMIWLFAIGLLTLRPNGGTSVSASYVLSRNSAVFGIISVLAPVLLAIFQYLF